MQTNFSIWAPRSLILTLPYDTLVKLKPKGQRRGHGSRGKVRINLASEMLMMCARKGEQQLGGEFGI